MTAGARREALAAKLPDGLDAMLVTHLVNVRYLTGFTGSSGALLVHRDGRAVFATDGRYATQAQHECPDLEHLITRRVGTDLAARAAADGVRTLGIEGHHVTLATHAGLADAAGEQVTLLDPARLDGSAHAKDSAQLVEDLRTVKDATELAALAAACTVTDEVFAAVLPRLRPGVTELDVAWLLREEMHVRGAEPAFDSIVAFGPHSAIPHHQPTDRPLARGDLVKLDFGARVDGYHADMTRTVVSGTAADWQRDLHALVRGVQEQGRAATRPGAVPAEVDALVRRAIEHAGQQLPHGLGHGVGLEIHENPFFGEGSAAGPLAVDVPVTVEPGVYLPGRGGVRIEDTVVVRADGCEPLTTSPRELLEV